MSQQIPPPAAQSTLMRGAKELFSALIAVGIMVCFFLMLGKAFEHVGKDEKTDPSFLHVKDLLLFVNPLVGVVVGYYFNKVSTEARAESAEAAVRTTTASAQQALAQRAEAESQARASGEDAREVREMLGEIIPAAEQVLEQIDPTPADAADVPGDADADPRPRLRAALRRARRATD
jgi:hypothetical protein